MRVLGEGTFETLVSFFTLARYSCCSAVSFFTLARYSRYFCCSSSVANRICGGSRCGSGARGGSEDSAAGLLTISVCFCGIALFKIMLRIRLSRSFELSTPESWDDAIMAG